MNHTTPKFLATNKLLLYVTILLNDRDTECKAIVCYQNRDFNYFQMTLG